MQVTEHSLFPTRVVSIQFEGVEKLNDDIYRFFTTNRDFQSDDYFKVSDHSNLLEMEAACPALGRLREMFLSGLRRWLQAEQVQGDFDVEIWAFPNFARQHEFTLVHNHAPDYHVAAVYYVKVPGAGTRPEHDQDDLDDYSEYWSQEGGVLVLHDPRFNANLAYLHRKDYKKIFPRAGQMVLFPIYVWHSVTPNRDAERRLSIAANFTLRPRESSAGYRVQLHLE
jgi:hypothetical protein